MKEKSRTFEIPDFNGPIDMLVGNLKRDGWEVRELAAPLELDVAEDPNQLPVGHIDHLEITSYLPKLTRYLSHLQIK